MTQNSGPEDGHDNILIKRKSFKTSRFKNRESLKPGTRKSDNGLIIGAVVFWKVLILIVDREKTYGVMEKLLNLKDIFGWSCLGWACRIGNLTVIKKLLFQGVDWTKDFNPKGRTVLHPLSVFGHAHIVEYFIKLDSEHQEPFRVPKATDNFGMTCLHRACFSGQTQVVQVILKAVPELNFELFMVSTVLRLFLNLHSKKEKNLNLYWKINSTYRIWMSTKWR